jgi:hypothetical protein
MMLITVLEPLSKDDPAIRACMYYLRQWMLSIGDEPGTQIIPGCLGDVVGMYRVRPRYTLCYSLGLHGGAFQTEISTTLACIKECTRQGCTVECTYIRSDNSEICKILSFVRWYEKFCESVEKQRVSSLVMLPYFGPLATEGFGVLSEPPIRTPTCVAGNGRGKDPLNAGVKQLVWGRRIPPFKGLQMKGLGIY